MLGGEPARGLVEGASAAAATVALSRTNTASPSKDEKTHQHILDTENRRIKPTSPSLSPPKVTSYNTVPRTLANPATEFVLPQFLGLCTEPSGPVFYSDDGCNGRRVNLHTTKDETLPPSTKELFLEKTHVEWGVRCLESGHGPFLSELEALAWLVGDVVRGFCLWPLRRDCGVKGLEGARMGLGVGDWNCWV
ncbi:hypothetical protein XANCAGTX0491_000717 [Xanthoria calcicola]